MANDNDYSAVLLEQIVDQNKAVLEAVVTFDTRLLTCRRVMSSTSCDGM